MNFLECFGGRHVTQGEHTFELNESFNGGFGGCNGGVLAALCVYASRDLAPQRVPTALDTRFIRGFKPGKAKVNATLLNEGRSISVISVDIFNEENKLCVRSTISLVVPSMLENIEHQELQFNKENLLALSEGKVWPQPKGPQIIPLINTFQPAYHGNNELGTATVTNVIWNEENTMAEAVCIAADISVGPPVARLVKGKAAIPNPDISLRFCGNIEVNQQLMAFCKTLSIESGIASNMIHVWNDKTLLAIGTSTTTCIKISA